MRQQLIPRVLLSFALVVLFALDSSAWQSVHDDWRGTPRLELNPVASTASTPSATAMDFVRANVHRYGLESDADLRLVLVQESLTAIHHRFEQFVDGIPVDTGELVISVDKLDGRVVKVANNLWPGPRLRRPVRAHLDEEGALDVAWQHLRVHGELLDLAPTAELTWEPSKDGPGLQLIWKARIHVQQPWGRWEVRLDAESGEVRSVRRTELARRPLPKADFQAWKGGVLDRAEATARLEARQASRPQAPTAVVDGTCDTFDPDPRTELMDDTLEDGSAIPAAAYVNRVLRDITLTGGTYSLVGPWVQITNHDNPNTAPSTTTTGDWNFTRGNNAFNDAHVYFHVDQNQRYMQSLGFTGGTGIQQLSIECDTDGAGGADNSFYSPGANTLTFGHGCVDDSEDADVVLHEYGHAIHESINPGWGGGDTGAIGEGFGDYWAGSYSFSTPNGPTFHPEWVFSWDGHNACWGGRLMNQTSYCYDDTATYGAHASVGGVLGDELWSTPLFQALVELDGMGIPRGEVDQIVLESHFGLVNGTTMRDLANATLAAATALYPSGPHHDVLEARFAEVCIIVLPQMSQPTLTYPAGGESLTEGTSETITWNTNGGPTNASYVVEYTDQCSPVLSFSDDMEGANNWTPLALAGNKDWVTSGTANSPVTSWFAVDDKKATDFVLYLTNPIGITAGEYLSFWHDVQTEGGYDGGTVEISTDGAIWNDLGPSFTQNPYNSTIASGAAAFSGSSGGWIESRADLSTWAGQNVQFRFRMRTDGSVAATGWWVDDVAVGTFGAWQTIGTSSPGASSIPWTVPTTLSSDYCVRISSSASGYLPAALETGSPFSVIAGSGGSAAGVPDGNFVAGTPLTATESGASVDVNWDASCASTEYAMYAGAIGDYSAITAASSCGLGTGGTTAGVPVFADAWFVISGIDGTSDVASFGRDSAAAQRSPTGWINLCPGIGTQDLGGACN